jgi:hypothetical protein
MHVWIAVDVKTRKQANDIQLALKHPDVRAFAIAVGALERLPDSRGRDQALSFVQDYFARPKPVGRDELHKTMRPKKATGHRRKEIVR